MELRNEINQVRLSYLSGLLTREDSLKILKPLVDEYNEKSKKIAKKYNRRFVKLSLIGILR
jgi:hypothetical protein